MLQRQGWTGLDETSRLFSKTGHSIHSGEFRFVSGKSKVEQAEKAGRADLRTYHFEEYC